MKKIKSSIRTKSMRRIPNYEFYMYTLSKTYIFGLKDNVLVNSLRPSDAYMRQ